MSDINDRIRKILNVKFSGNVSEMARSSKIPQPTLNNIVGNRLSKPSFENLEKLLKSDKMINARWLLTGEGEMHEEKNESIDQGYKEKYLETVEKYTAALEDLRVLEKQKKNPAREGLDAPDVKPATGT